MNVNADNFLAVLAGKEVSVFKGLYGLLVLHITSNKPLLISSS